MSQHHEEESEAEYERDEAGLEWGYSSTVADEQRAEYGVHRPNQAIRVFIRELCWDGPFRACPYYPGEEYDGAWKRWITEVHPGLAGHEVLITSRRRAYLYRVVPRQYTSISIERV